MRLEIKCTERENLENGFVMLICDNGHKIVICEKLFNITDFHRVQNGLMFIVSKSLGLYKDTYPYHVIYSKTKSPQNLSFNITEKTFNLLKQINSVSDYEKVIGLVKEQL